jgi:hypothetical protein
MKRIAFAVLAFAALGTSAYSQSKIVSQTASFGPLVPGKAGTPATVMVPFVLPISKLTATSGYHIQALSSFVFTPSAPEAGGKSVAAKDIGIGIIGLSSTAMALGNAAITTGFNQDPTAPTTGQASLGDLLSGIQVLQVGKMPAVSLPASGGFLTMTLKLAVPKKFFTPGAFSGTVTLIVTP